MNILHNPSNLTKNLRLKISSYTQSLFWVLFTYLLSPIFYGWIFLRKRKKSSTPKILIIQLGKIGDMVCTTPIFRETKKKFAQSHLSVIVIPRSKDVLRNNPHIDEIFLITDYPSFFDKFRLINKLRKERYDWALSLDIAGAFLNILSFWCLIPNRITMTYKPAGEIMRSLFIFSNYRLEYKRGTSVLDHRLSLLKFMGINKASGEKEVFITSVEEKKADDFLAKNGLLRNDKIIGISVSAGIKETEWDISRFAKLADQLIEKNGAKIVFVGSTFDIDRIIQTQKLMKNQSINSAGKFELFELPALMEKIKLFISVDSGPVYIADALKIPIVNIMGPSNLREQSPTGLCKVIQKDIDCHPCLFVFSGVRNPVCSDQTFRCLKKVSVDEVLKSVNDLIS